MTAALTIRPADTCADVGHVADVIARSFDHLAPSRFLIPDSAQREPVLRQFFGLLVEQAVDGGGEVLLTDGGVAVWFDRTTETATPDGYEQRLTAAVAEHIDRFRELDALLESHHPTAPHWHLAFLAVEPGRWGQGIGGALMRHTHRRLDEQGIAAYLEAGSSASKQIYRRHGYTELDPPTIHLSDGTPFYPMWRPAPPH